jgi:hypothetical protein
VTLASGSFEPHTSGPADFSNAPGITLIGYGEGDESSNDR